MTGRNFLPGRYLETYQNSRTTVIQATTNPTNHNSVGREVVTPKGKW